MDNSVKEYIREEFDRLKDLPARERNSIIIEEVKTKFNEIVDGSIIYEICVRTKRLRDAIKELNDQVEEKKLWEVVDGNYHFIKDSLLYKVSVEEIDEMFYDFSAKGGNLSGEEMLAKYKLKPEVWHMIKSRLRLYKASNVISPYTAENTPEEELDEKIEEATTRHIDSIKEKMVKTHERQFKAEAKRSMKVLSNIEYFLENVERYIKDYKPIDIDFESSPLLNNDVKHFVITDIHIGKINSKDVIARIDKVHNEIINSPESIIYLTCLGDLVETLAQDGMHPAQISHGMDHEYGFGFDLMMTTVNIFERFLLSLKRHGKKVIFNGITGNHGRTTSRKEDDVDRTGELVIFELIKRGLSNAEMEFHYHREAINTFGYGNLHFIIAHGDNRFAERKPSDVLWKHGDNHKHNIILLGDRHNVQVKEDKNSTWILAPALAGQGHYDKSMDLYSEAGYVIIKENEYGTPDVTIKRLR